MEKTVQLCGICGTQLTFRAWSNRYAKSSPWQEALAECQAGCGFWQLRYFKGNPTCDPYQVKQKAEKTATGSYRLTPERKAAIIDLWGSVQNYLDYGSLLCITEQLNP